MDKPTKPSNLMPRSFGGVKNNWSAGMQSSGYEDGVPAIYGGDNLNYQLDATGKELDYCEKICDFINDIPIGKTITVDSNNKLVYDNLATDISGKANIALDNLDSNGKARIAVKQYLITETYALNDVVMGIIDDEVKLFKSLVASNTGNALSDDTKWEEVQLGGSTRNIGEIVQSTIPLTDAGLHLLDGSLLAYGSYQAFIDYIADLYDSGDYTDIFETEANWQTAVTTYGVCGKFVYDSVNNTVRLPKYRNKIYTGGGSAPVKGNGKSLCLSDGTNTLGLGGRSIGTENVLASNTAAFDKNVGTSYTPSTYNATGKAIGVTTDGTKSGIIADLANITASVDGYYYIVIATSTKTDIEVDIDEIATDLNGKLDRDCLNYSDTGYSVMAGAGMPSVRYIDLTLGASGSTYTAPANGWVVLTANGSGNIGVGQRFFVYDMNGSQNGDWYSVLLPVMKGTFTVYYNNVTKQQFRFYYAQGSESEAQ